VIYRDVEQDRLPLTEAQRVEATERALLAALPELFDSVERRELINSLLGSLDRYHQLGLDLEITTGTQIQAASGLEMIFTQNLPDGNHITPVLMRDILYPALSKNPEFMGRQREGVLEPALGKKTPFTIKVKPKAQVIGLTWPKPGESFKECYERADILRQSVLWYTDPTLVGRRKHFDLDPVVAVVTDQQLRQWVRSKESILLPPESYRERAPSLRKVMEVVTAALRQAGLENTYFPRVNTLSNHEVEVMIVDQDGNFAPIDMLGLRHMNGGSRFATEWVTDCIGIKCFEPDISETFRIERVRTLSHHFRTIHEGEDGRPPSFKVLSLTPKLLEYWEMKLYAGENFIRESKKRADEFGDTGELEAVHVPEPQQTSQLQHVRYLTFEKYRPSIGAKPSWLVYEFSDGTAEFVCLDFGSQREDFYYNSMFKPSIKLGMAPFKDILPTTAEIPMFYRMTLLLKSAETIGAAFLEEPDKNSDLIDLYLRLTPSDFRRLLRALDSWLSDSEITKFMENMERIVQNDASIRKIRHTAFLISHFHDDHTGFAALTGSHIPQVTSAESAPWPSHFFFKGGWMDEHAIRRQRETLLTPKKDGHFSPQQLMLQPYETRFIGRGKVSVTCLPCDHSIYGACMFLVTAYDDFGLPMHKTLYSGDYRFRDNGLTEKSVEFLKAIGGVDAVITETTNVRPPNANVKKSPSSLTKEMLHDNYDRLFAEHRGKPVIVQVDPKDLSLIELISQHALRHGRKIVYGLKHSVPIELFRQFDAANAMTPITTEHQERSVDLLAPKLPDDHWLRQEPVRTLPYHPRPQFSQDTRIVEPQKESLNKIERQIVLYHAEQLLQWKELAHDGNAVIFVRPTNPLEEELANIDSHLGKPGESPRAVVVRAHYFTYQERDRDIAWRDRKHCQKLNWSYLTDLQFNGQAIQPSQNPQWRMSGHSKQEDFFAFMETLLSLNPEMKIIPVHGEKRGYVAPEIQRRFGPKVDVIGKVDKGRFELQLY